MAGVTDLAAAAAAGSMEAVSPAALAQSTAPSPREG